MFQSSNAVGKVRSRLSTKEISWTCPEQIIKISRDQDVKLVATISYQLLPEDAYPVVQNVTDWEEALQKLFVGTMQSVINELTPADFLNWSSINETLERRVQDKVASWGVQIIFVRIQDLTLISHLAPDVNPGAIVANLPVIAPVPVASIDMLKDAYEAVRVGRIKDPNTIRNFAWRFEVLANDPNLSFDAARASHILYNRAWLYERESEQKAGLPNEPIRIQPTEEYPSMEPIQPKPHPQQHITEQAQDSKLREQVKEADQPLKLIFTLSVSGLAGISIIVLQVFLSGGKLDIPSTISVYALALAIPMLACSVVVFSIAQIATRMMADWRASLIFFT
jgi:SPFH domain / Band 7 family